MRVKCRAETSIQTHTKAGEEVLLVQIILLRAAVANVLNNESDPNKHVSLRIRAIGIIAAC